MRKAYRGTLNCGLCILLLACWPLASLKAQSRNSELNVTINQADGSYAISAAGASAPALQAGVAAKVDGRWLQSKNYPHHAVKQSSVADDLGQAQEWTITFSGLSGAPDLRYRLRNYTDKPHAYIQA